MVFHDCLSVLKGEPTGKTEGNVCIIFYIYVFYILIYKWNSGWKVSKINENTPLRSSGDTKQNK